jgi:hypothetical protein
MVSTKLIYLPTTYLNNVSTKCEFNTCEIKMWTKLSHYIGVAHWLNMFKGWHCMHWPHTSFIKWWCHVICNYLSHAVCHPKTKWVWTYQ